MGLLDMGAKKIVGAKQIFYGTQIQALHLLNAIIGNVSLV